MSSVMFVGVGARTSLVVPSEWGGAIMFCVFGSFVIGDVRVLKVFGLGLAAAVLIDATVVRMVLVPATMELLGKANWWMPRWLDRVLPHVNVEGHAETRPLGPTSPAPPSSNGDVVSEPVSDALVTSARRR